MSIPGKIRTDYHSKQLKCHNSFNVPAIKLKLLRVNSFMCASLRVNSLMQMSEGLKHLKCGYG